MTQRAKGNFNPQTLPGQRGCDRMDGRVDRHDRGIHREHQCATLTIKHLQGLVHGVSDLSTAQSAYLAGTAAADTLTHMRVNYQVFATLRMASTRCRPQIAKHWFMTSRCLPGPSSRVIRPRSNWSMPLSIRRNMPSCCGETVRSGDALDVDDPVR